MSRRSNNGVTAGSGSIALAIGVAMMVLAAPALGQVKRFKANSSNPSQALTLSPGLSYTFSDRTIPTVDPLGAAVASDKPRFDRLLRIAGVSTPDPVDEKSGYIWASGYDHNGTTELMAWFRTGNQILRIYSGGGSGTFVESPTHSRPKFGGGTFQDLLGTAGSGGPVALTPKCAAIYHGVIVVAGAAWKLRPIPAQGYELVGWAIATNEQQGSGGWTLEWDDTADRFQVGQDRGREWCIRLAPIYERGTAYPTQCWVSCSDYVSNNPQGGAHARGGRVYVFKMTRPPQGSPSDWTIGAGTATKVKYFTITQPTQPPPAGVADAGLHVHSAQVTEWQPADSDIEGLQVIAGLGDHGYNNRFWRAIFPDRMADYTTLAWTVQDNFHGVSGTDYTQSRQSSSLAFGPSPREIYTGVDEQTDMISIMELPEDGAVPQQAKFKHQYGFATGFGRADVNPYETINATFFFPINAIFNQSRIELGGPMVTVMVNRESQDEPAACRVLHHSGITGTRGDWTPVASIRGTSSRTAALYGGHVYLCGFTYGLQRVPVPQFRSMRPIMVAPGGLNLVIQNCERDLMGATEFAGLTSAPPVGQGWVDPLASRTLPPAPCKADKLFRIQTAVNNTSNQAGRIRVSGQGSAWNQVQPGGWQTQPSTVRRVRRFRGWVLDGSFGQLTPNKTLQMSAAFDDAETVFSPQSHGVPINYSCDDRWSPCTRIGDEGLADGTGLGILIRSVGPKDTTEKDANYLYFLPDVALDGNGSLPYPMAPQPATGAPITGLDELLTISGLGLSQTAGWSFRMAGMHPNGNWDQYAQRGAVDAGGTFQSDAKWPLFTLWGDANNYVEFLANCDTKAFLVRVKAAGTLTDHAFGTGEQFWLPGSPLFVGFGFDPGGDTEAPILFVGASLGSFPVAVVPNGIQANFTTALTELRFRGASGEVVEYAWFGGEIDTTNPSLNNGSLPTAFSNLTFLDGP